MKSFRLLPALAAVAIAASLGSPAAATSVRKMSLRDLAPRSDLVFAGTVRSVEEVALVDQSMAYTFVTFVDLDVLAGAFDGVSLTLRFDGGALGPHERIDVPGMPRFVVGDRVVVFANAGNGRCPCPVTGWGQGRLRVVESASPDDPILEDESGNVIHGIRDGAFVKSLVRPAEDPVHLVPAEDDREEPLATGNTSVVPEELKSQRLSLSALRAAVLEIRAQAATLGNRQREVRSADPRDLPPTGEGPCLPLPASVKENDR